MCLSSCAITTAVPGVRSFDERRLGPIARDGTPLGGTQAQTFSGEISYEIAKYFFGSLALLMPDH